MKFTDEQLMDYVKEGKEWAFKELFVRYFNKLDNFLSKFDPMYSDDLASETLTKVYKYRTKYKSGSKVSGWVFKIAYNHGIDHIRKLKKKPHVTTDLNDLKIASIKEKNHNPYEIVHSKELGQQFRNQIEKLTDSEKRIYLLHREEDKSFREISTELQISIRTVEYTLMQVDKKLRIWYDQSLDAKNSPVETKTDINKEVMEKSSFISEIAKKFGDSCARLLQNHFDICGIDYLPLINKNENAQESIVANTRYILLRHRIITQL